MTPNHEPKDLWATIAALRAEGRILAAADALPNVETVLLPAETLGALLDTIWRTIGPDLDVADAWPPSCVAAACLRRQAPAAYAVLAGPAPEPGTDRLADAAAIEGETLLGSGNYGYLSPINDRKDNNQ